MLDTSKDVHPRIKELRLESEYPFASHYIQTPMGRMHYLDEGAENERSTVLAVHGNPTWSFLYRALVKGLSAERRIVVPDHIGFGLSEKPDDEAAYTLKAHIDHLEALVLHLDLTDITLVMQDWGGPIGLGVAARHPGRDQGACGDEHIWVLPTGRRDEPGKTQVAPAAPHDAVQRSRRFHGAPLGLL
ncbi:alpha/beta fold hydrolase [Tateyamaria armeniaca]|uniref:Alpha/beta fold hydrolase n=1 Tax=Tateyamaria armeniaca TaxID=2518930 RepID=A0ABW8USG4_9RHOB